MANRALARYLATARLAGCDRDQLVNFRRAYYVAQPMQLRFHGAARLCDSPRGPDQVGVGGARGPGKSHAVFAQLCLDDCQRAPGLRGLYLRKIGKNAREQLEALRSKVLGSIEHTYNRSNGVIEFPNGSTVFMGHFRTEGDVDQYLGLEYDVIVIEEATTLTRTKYQALRDSNRSSRTDFRPRIYSSTNPGGVGHVWYKKLFIDPWRTGQEDGGPTRFVFGTVEDNAFVDEGYRTRLEGNTGWRLRAYRFGDWDILAGQFFETWRHDVHVRAPRHKPLPTNWAYYLAMDYGFTHWNVIYLLARSREGVVYYIDELAARKTLVPVIAQELGAMLGRWDMPKRKIRRFVAGSDCFMARGETGESIADLWAKAGYKIEVANTDRINGAAAMLGRLGDQSRGIPPTLFVSERCPRLIETIPLLTHDPARPEDVLKIDVDEEGSGGDDPYEAARYGLMATVSPYGPVTAHEY